MTVHAAEARVGADVLDCVVNHIFGSSLTLASVREQQARR